MDTRIAYANRTAIRVVAGDGTGDGPLATPGDGLLAWRPGKGFVLAYMNGAQLRVKDLATGRVRIVNNVGGETDDRYMSWARDGRRLIVVRAFEIALVEPERGVTQVIPTLAKDFISAASFSPDGRRLGILHTGELVIVDARKPRAVRRRILGGAFGAFSGLTWSPDGRWLLVGLPAADQWLFVRADGGSIRAVSNVSEQFRSREFPRVEGWCCAP